MNEHVALWPKLSLARELPFMLAGTQVRPSALEVETDGRLTMLEPRVMKVLVALHRARGHPVSRDELIDLCWDGRIVTEGALNRCVAQLRKALSDNPRIRLDTIPTVGYRLKAVGEVRRMTPVAPAVTPAEETAGKAPSRRWRWAAGGVGAAVAASLGAFALLGPREVAWTAQSYHPLTAERGLETHPAISPNGEQIVYAQRPDSSVGRDLYIRGVDQGTPVRITTHPHDDHSAAWSPRGDRIVFVRTAPTGPCQLVVAPVPLGPERVAATCQSSTHTRVGWLDENTLAIGDRPAADALWRIRAVDLTSGAVRDLTAPPADTLGDSDPAVSPDGRYVAFRRTLLHGADDLFLKDLRTGRERALTTDGWKAAGYVWSADSRHIFYSSNRGGEFGLWTVDTARDAPPRRISLGFGQLTFSRMSIDRRNRLAVELPRGRTNIAAVTPPGAVRPVTNAASSDWEPDAAADGAVAYVSNRSGSSELWVTHPGGQSVRLTNIVGSYVNSPTWSPDGRRLAFVAVKGRKAEVYTVERDGSRLRAVTSDGRDKLDPVWSPGGDRIRYLERRGGAYRIMQVAVAPGAKPEVLFERPWRELRAAPDGRLFGLPVGGERVEAAGGTAPRVEVAANDAWTVGRDGIYLFLVRRDAPPAVWLHPWNGPPRKLAEVPAGTGELGVAPDGRLLVSQNLDEQTDLGLFELSAAR
ncbi:winged helix-turn-helix domain-containing protein [Phenylobacterium sp.]|uniref:winged helix-turn-helix domain-containing protein n=1 Tax=Phenylobacterium sp. TaxID=1871053 RepID=UPI0028127CEC|nr:winged helix-turn-helix domain-containing protein [Phenylobacterium sp.]